MPAKTVIQLRRDTSTNWDSVNPILSAGEAGFETDTSKLKIGDGTTAWSSLAAPTDGTWVRDLEPMPEGYEAVLTKKTYFWMDDIQTWGIEPCMCNPRPSLNHYWNYLTGEWEVPDSEKPSDDYLWSPIQKAWVEIEPTPIEPQ